MQNKNCKITICPPAYAQGYYDTVHEELILLNTEIKDSEKKWQEEK